MTRGPFQSWFSRILCQSTTFHWFQVQTLHPSQTVNLPPYDVSPFSPLRFVKNSPLPVVLLLWLFFQWILLVPYLTLHRYPVPLGSVLGPLPFLLKIPSTDNLTDTFRSSYHLCANDTDISLPLTHLPPLLFVCITVALKSSFIQTDISF